MSSVWNSIKKYFSWSLDTTENHGSCSSRKEIEEREINLEHNQNLIPPNIILDESGKVDDERKISDSQKYFDEEFLDSVTDERTNSSQFGHPVSESDLQNCKNFRESAEEAGIADMDRRWVRNERIDKNMTNPDFYSLKKEKYAVDNLYNESYTFKGEDDSADSSFDGYDQAATNIEDLKNKSMLCIDNETNINNSSTGSYEEDTGGDKDDLRNISEISQPILQDFSKILPDITSDESSEDESLHIVVAANKPVNGHSLVISDLLQLEENDKKVEEEFMESYKTMSHLSKEKWKVVSSPRGDKNMPELEFETEMEIGQKLGLDAQRIPKVRSLPEIERVKEDTQQSVKHPFLSQGKNMPGLEDEMKGDLKSVGGTTFHTSRNISKVRNEKQIAQESVNLSSINIPYSSDIDLKFSSTHDMEKNQETVEELSTSRLSGSYRKHIEKMCTHTVKTHCKNGSGCTNSSCLNKKNTELGLENELKMQEDSRMVLELVPNENDKTNKAEMGEERVGKILVNSASTSPIKKRTACENKVEIEKKSIPSTLNMGLLTSSYGKKNQDSMDESSISSVPEVRNEHNPKHFVGGVHNSLHEALDLALKCKGEVEWASKVPSISHLKTCSVSSINYNGKMNETFNKDVSLSRNIQEVNNTGAICQQTLDEALRKNALKNGMKLGFQYKEEAKLGSEVMSSMQGLEMGPKFSPYSVDNRTEESENLYLSHRVQNCSEAENDFCNTSRRMLESGTTSIRSLVSKSEMGTQFNGKEMLKADTLCNTTSISKAEMETQTIFKESPRVQHADIVADFQQHSRKMLGSGILISKADMETQTVFGRESPRGQNFDMVVDFHPASGRALGSNRVEMGIQMNGRKMSGSGMLSNWSSFSKAEMETQTIFGTESPRVEYSEMKHNFQPHSENFFGPSTSSNKLLVSKGEFGTQVNEKILLGSGTWPNQSSVSKAEMGTQTTLITESSRVKNPLMLDDFQQALGRIFGLKTVPNYSSSSKAEMGTQTTFLTASPRVCKPEDANWNMTPAVVCKKNDKFYVQEGLGNTMINKSPLYEYVIHVPIGSYSSEISSPNSQINTTPNRETKQIKKLLDVNLHSRLDFNPNSQQISKTVPKHLPSVSHASHSSVEGNTYLRKSGFNSALSPQIKAGPSGFCVISPTSNSKRSKVAFSPRNSSSTKPYYFICTTSTDNVETTDSKVDGTDSPIAVGEVKKVVNCINTMEKCPPMRSGESYLEQNSLKMIQNDILETKMVLADRSDKKSSAKSLLSRICAASKSSIGNGSVGFEKKGKSIEKKNFSKVSQPIAGQLANESFGSVHEASINTTSSSTVLKFSPEQLMNRTSKTGEEATGNQEKIATISKPVAEEPTALSTEREEAKEKKNEITLAASEPAVEQVINNTSIVKVEDDTVTSISIAAKTVEDQLVNQITRSKVKENGDKQTKSSKVSKPVQKPLSSGCSRKRKYATNFGKKKKMKVANDFPKPTFPNQIFLKNARALRKRTSDKNYKT